jgi:hypothetical protein
MPGRVGCESVEQASALTFYTFQQRTAVEAATACGYQPALGASLWGIKPPEATAKPYTRHILGIHTNTPRKCQ